MASINKKQLQTLHQEKTLRSRSNWTVLIANHEKPLSESAIDCCWELYSDVHAKALELATFPIPRKYLEVASSTEGWELLILHKAECKDKLPAGFLICNKLGDEYVPLLCGIDYSLQDMGLYQNMLLASITRARELGFATVNLGMASNCEKKRLGCVPVEHTMCFHVNNEDMMEGVQMPVIISERLGF